MLPPPFFRRHIVTVSVFAAVNAVRVQIVLINEENATAHICRKPAIISTEPAALLFFSARRIAVPAARSAKSWGAQIIQLTRWPPPPRANPNRPAHRDRHTPFEIAIGGANRGLPFFHQAATKANAGSTTGRQRNCACVQQRLPIASDSAFAALPRWRRPNKIHAAATCHRDHAQLRRRHADPQTAHSRDNKYAF